MSWNEPGGDNKDPWSGRGDQKGPPDLDEAIRKALDKLSNLFGGGGGDGQESTGGPRKNLGLIVVGAIAAIWIASGTYKVDAGNIGVVTRFGKYVGETSPGLNWHLPVPIERVDIVNVEQNRTLAVGFSSFGEAGDRSEPKEALMLTRDENYVDVRLVVQYKVSNLTNSAKKFLFNVADPATTLKQVTEGAERGVIGSSDMDFVLTEGRNEIVTQIKKEIQEVMDRYETGIEITSVNLQDAQAPEQVQAAFQDVIKAREDKQRLINEAEAYSNDIVPKARGAAARMLQEAQGYKDRVIAQAEGETNRFSKMLGEYLKQPDVTRKRLYIDTMESVLGEANVVMVDVKGGNNIFYLPLDKMAQKLPEIESQSVAPAAKAEAAPVETEEQPAAVRPSFRGREARGRQ
ncbi:FtsH protease activity modulator HflK [Candidatus Methylomicrobium oryzae]|jgi:membrane protease subunit HflK|uniref:FtsH protease activity modulator HflK n=1 Tax=Candidatus Methylomicrobium oryzae TaxID=2802053 RepID=UPI0019217DBB|nr:FtsH protease activity modulator HflK [Methylomicrobium sp. RS1]MBL1264497.1 FtsH protease activity modulator HflK [Methylomicrobium sp. RS1]